MTNNNVNINVSKTKAMLFSTHPSDVCVHFNSIPIEFVQSIKCLGVVIDDKLGFDQHIDGVVTRTNVTLRRLYNCDLMLPHHIKEKLVHALIMPNILYCIEVYAGTLKRNTDKVERALKSAMRYLHHINRFAHVSPFLETFLGCSFSEFIGLRSLVLFYKIYKNQFPLFLCKSFTFTRSSRSNQLIIPTLDHFVEKSFSVRVTRLFNKLPVALRYFNVSEANYRKKILLHFQTIS